MPLHVLRARAALLLATNVYTCVHMYSRIPRRPLILQQLSRRGDEHPAASGGRDWAGGRPDGAAGGGRHA
jgi:hypothetical protein